MDTYNKILTEAVEKFPYDQAYPYNKDNIREVLELSMARSSYRYAYLDFTGRFRKIFNFLKNLDNQNTESINHYLEWKQRKNQWRSHYLPLVYTARYPVKRTREEAAEIFTEKMIELIFDKPAELNASAKWKDKATLDMKTTALTEISAEQIDKFRSGCLKYAMDSGCPFLSVNHVHKPDADLYKILKESGIPGHKMKLICPKITSVYIDTVDNIVYIRQNGNEICLNRRTIKIDYGRLQQDID